MKKRLILNFLVVCLLLVTLAPAASALGPSASGTCGDNLTWKLEDYTLTITGSGEMADDCSWKDYQDKVEHVVLTGGVTTVAAQAFYNFDRLETVDFGDALVEIGEKAFYGCTDIDYIHLPATFRIFGPGSFRECVSLKYVYCDGPMPSFRDSCLWTGNYISVFYPTNIPWPGEYVSQLVSNFGGRLGIMMGNFDASAVAELLSENETQTEETEEATEAAEETEAAVAVAAETEPVVVETKPVETTVPETQPEPTETTVPETEETTVPTTEAEETTEAAEETEETEPETVAQKVGGDGWIGMVIIAGVLTFLLVGALIFRIVSRKNGQYKA